MKEPFRPGRRDMLRLGLAATTALVVRRVPAAAGTNPIRSLAFRNLHTGEYVEQVYWADGRVLHEALREISWVLRDHRTGEARQIDPRLLDFLRLLRAKLDTNEPFEVISGYRSPATNAMLARTTTGVARGSLHVRGMAIDIRVPGHALATLHEAALSLRLGGVGYYPRSDFVHVDVGRVRTW